MADPDPPQTCDGLCDLTGKCDPRHPIHCCHFVVTVRRGKTKGYQCQKCGKGSKTWTKVKTDDPDVTI
jgi:hypothetical protein